MSSCRSHSPGLESWPGVEPSIILYQLNSGPLGQEKQLSQRRQERQVSFFVSFVFFVTWREILAGSGLSGLGCVQNRHPGLAHILFWRAQASALARLPPAALCLHGDCELGLRAPKTYTDVH